jgi:hypothetical protein
MDVVSKLHDRRVDCYSILTTMTVGEFLDLVGAVYEKRGGIEGQRAPLRTKTALSIRSRMVADLAAGAVIPPVVVGIHGTAELTNDLVKEPDGKKLLADVKAIETDRISIIDGMQRTTALLEATKDGAKIAADALRVEFWISESLNSLIYRMLVLNTGQVPWEIARQLETVYSQLLGIIKQELGNDAEIFGRDDARRRSEPGQYQASLIIRLFLAFSSRRAEFDLRDRVAEDFARLDAIEASSHRDFLQLFIRTMRLVVDLDHAFSRAPNAPKTSAVRIADGQEIFQSGPALVGFAVAVAIKLFDEPDFDVDWSNVEAKMAAVEGAVHELTGKLQKMEPESVDEFLQLGLLNDRLAQRSGQVGRFERDLFIRAFTKMIDNAARLKDMTPCWRA